MTGVSLYETKRETKKQQKSLERLVLCDFNGILTGQNIAKKGRANIINKVQTEWSVMKSLRKTAVGAYLRKIGKEEPD